MDVTCVRLITSLLRTYTVHVCPVIVLCVCLLLAYSTGTPLVAYVFYL